MNLETIAYKHALKNAYDYGRANEKAVAGKVFKEFPEARKNPKSSLAVISSVVSRVNSLTRDQIERELSEKFPEMLEKKREGKRKELPPLPGAEQGKVVTRMPPEPNAYPHLGHAMSFFFNWYYARKYGGKVILRFDDTNPKKEKLEYYQAIKEGLEWLGLDWDMEHNMSDDMDRYYSYAEQLIRIGKAYVCTCKEEEIKKGRAEGKECEHRGQSVEENLELWDRMLEGGFNEGEAILRYKGDMKSKNTVMRDPTLARVILEPHPIQGDKYIVWPTYDFACAIEDAILGITHVLRSNEFELRNELQRAIRRDLGLRQPMIIHYSRFKVEGTVTSKRKIRALIDEGKVTGWDDPRLVTLAALRRRGILPETIKELAVEIGLSTSQPVISWDIISSINRKILDERADRYFLVVDPVELEVENAPEKTAVLRNHPRIPEKGTRELKTDGHFFISKSDAERLSPGTRIRLKDLYNIKILEIKKSPGRMRILAEYVGEELEKRVDKIQWVTRTSIPITLLVPGPLFLGEDYNPDSLERWSCLGEPSLKKLGIGEIVQFERVGFARKDSEGVWILAHR